MKKILPDPKILAEKIHKLIKMDPYAQSLVSLEKYYEKALVQYAYGLNNVNTWYPFLIYTDDNNIEAVLNAEIIFDTAEIDFIFVKETARGQGIAKKFILTLEKICQKMQPVVKRILLEVGKNNIPAVNLYQKCGFKQISVRKKYYKGIEDALIMEKTL